MAVVVYHMFTCFFLFSLGLYHLLLSTISYLKPPPPSSSSSSSSRSSISYDPYTARPFYPLPIGSHHHRLLRHLPLVLSLVFFVLTILFILFLPSSSSPSSSSLLTFQFLPPLFLFSLIFFALLFFPSCLHIDLVFLLSSLSFALLSSASYHLSAAYPPSDLQSKASSISSNIWAFSALSSLALAFSHCTIFLAELSLACSVALAGLWSLQSGLLLYADSFIPDGCHLLLDTAAPTTRCDLVESQVRADAMLDLAFFLHAAFVAAVSLGVYAAVATICGGGAIAITAAGSSSSSSSSSSLFKRHNAGGSYEALPLSGLGDVENNNNNNITMMQQQMKPLSKSSIAQE